MMTLEQIREDVASHGLGMNDADFRDWLQEKAAAEYNHGPYTDHLSAYLAGMLSDEWFEDHASPAA